MAQVLRLNIKGAQPGAHGLPKHPVPSAQLDFEGFSGDFNRYRHEELRDEADSAVLLLPIETVRDLQRDGWPVEPGHLGENVTTEGVPYNDLNPGSVWSIGSAVVRVTRACDPCTNLYLLPYVGPTRGPAFVKTMVGRRGWYARVVDPGVVRVGDPIQSVSLPELSPSED